MTERQIVTPTGFIDVEIVLDSPAPLIGLEYTRTFVSIWRKDMDETLSDDVPVILRNRVSIPVKPGCYNIRANLGALSSETTEVKVEAGQVVKLKFFFGK